VGQAVGWEGACGCGDKINGGGGGKLVDAPIGGWGQDTRYEQKALMRFIYGSDKQLSWVEPHCSRLPN